jgi:Reverse transcriptase (RNA-dependent DNA polymerase)
MAKSLIQTGDWFAKLDLKDAYLTVPVHVDHQKYLRFLWEMEIYQFLCLPFGLSSAPRLFTKILKPAIAYLRKQGFRLVIYLDDMLLIGSSKEEVALATRRAVTILECLGFVINWEKSSTSPAQLIEFLGMIIDSKQNMLSLPLSKVEEICQRCEHVLTTQSLSLRTLASLLGNARRSRPFRSPSPITGISSCVTS